MTVINLLHDVCIFYGFTVASMLLSYQAPILTMSVKSVCSAHGKCLCGC
jgi:hypothetical protein